MIGYVSGGACFDCINRILGERHVASTAHINT